MKVKVAYGKNGLEIQFPDNIDVTVARATKQEALKDPRLAIKAAIKNPIGTNVLKDIIESKARDGKASSDMRCCIVVSDHTRPVPTGLLLPPLLDELEEAGIDRNKITVLVATGLHRASTPGEIERMIGSENSDRVSIINHDANDKGSLAFIGTSSRGTDAWINKAYVEADVKITTGYVDPHFFAGYAGGRKTVVPGIAGADTILANHSAAHVASIHSRFMQLRDNPIHEDAVEIAGMVGVDFTVNLCLNPDHEVTAVAAGHYIAAHDHLVEIIEDKACKVFTEPFDIVIVNNGGYPLDLNLYQAVKSMAIGELIVKENGIIIAVNELSDGFGPDGFKETLESIKDPKRRLDDILEGSWHVDSQWQIQILLRVVTKAEILIVSSIPVADFEKIEIPLRACKDVNSAISHALERAGKNARILVLPDGPQLIARLKEGESPL